MPFRLFLNPMEGYIDVHWHEFFELVFVLSGTGSQVLNGVTMPLTPGTLFLLTPADFHELQAIGDAPCLHYNFIFSDEALRKELYELLFQTGRSLLSCQIENEAIPRLEAEFATIWSELYEEPGIGSSLFVQSTLERILVELARRTSTVKNRDAALGHLESTTSAAVRSVMTYLQLHFREPFTLEQGAKLANLSPNYFSRCFRELAGITLQSYLQELRLQFASSLLKVTDLPVTEICFASGFSTLSHFERAFKRKFSKAPSHYRK
jgi:AraC-like DNA-binding protein